MNNQVEKALLIVALIFLAGCGGRGNPTAPTDNPAGTQATAPIVQTGETSNRILFGYWDVQISADRKSVEVVSNRAAMMHLNITGLLESVCSDCLKIENFEKLEDGSIQADFVLKHPYPLNPKLAVFDVRGILMSGSDYTLPVHNLKIAWWNDVLRMLNPDGYTTLFNPTDYPPSGPLPPVLKYIPGKYATGGDLSATLNPFVAYREDYPRRMFRRLEWNVPEVPHFVHLSLPSGPVKFGYAVDANWVKVDGPIGDPIKDYPLSANCPEAYQINLWSDATMDTVKGSTIPINAEVFDHQGFDTISAVMVECPALFDGEMSLTYQKPTTADGFLFTGTVSNDFGADYGEYPLVVRVIDKAKDLNLGEIDGWQVLRLPVKGGWARTWGGSGQSIARSVGADNSGNVYTSGECGGGLDLDPGHGTADENGKVFLSKFDTKGVFLWGRAWDAYSARGQAVDQSGNVYVCGGFDGTVDFDPGSAVTEYTSPYSDIYLSKFDSDGNFLWARVWGSDYGEVGGGGAGQMGYDVTVDQSGFAYVTGSFEGTADFDPGPAIDEHISNGGYDVFLSKFSPDGDFIWARTWGSSTFTSDNWVDVGLGVEADHVDGIVVTGQFCGDVDFDPGPGSFQLSSGGWVEPFLSKFDTSGNFQWADAWKPGYSLMNPSHLLGTDFENNIYVTGASSYYPDFDPGPGWGTMYYHDAAYVSKFNSVGQFQWARRFEAANQYSGSLVCSDIVADPNGNLVVSGIFWGTIDLDPADGTDYLEQFHGWDSNRASFLCSLTSDGNFRWGVAWPTSGTSGIETYGLGLDPSGHIYAAGLFYDNSSVYSLTHGPDFDPGPGYDLHKGYGYSGAFLMRFPPDAAW